MKKMKHFDSPEGALSYLTSELLETLKDDLGKMEREERRHYTNDDRKEMKAKIADIETIEGHIGIIDKSNPSQSLCILRAFMSALPDMEGEDNPMDGGDVVQTLSDYWPDFKRAVAEDETRQYRDKKADEFIGMIARMKTEEEFGEDAPPSEDWISTLNDLIVWARALTKKGN